MFSNSVMGWNSFYVHTLSKIDQRKSQKLTQIHDISVQRVPWCGAGDMTPTKQLLRVWAGGREAGAG